MFTIRLVLAVIITSMLVACEVREVQVFSPQVPAVNNQPEQDLNAGLDLLELIILDTDSLPPGCTTQVIYSYGRRGWAYMHPSRDEARRFSGGILQTTIGPNILVGSNCGNAEGRRNYIPYHGRIGLWRKSANKPWQQQQPGMQYEVW